MKVFFYGYKYKKNEPIKVEYRIEDKEDRPKDSDCCYIEDFNSICTTSLLFANKNYLEKIQNYDEGKIFENYIIKFDEQH